MIWNWLLRSKTSLATSFSRSASTFGIASLSNQGRSRLNGIIFSWFASFAGDMTGLISEACSAYRQNSTSFFNFAPILLSIFFDLAAFFYYFSANFLFKSMILKLSDFFSFFPTPMNCARGDDLMPLKFSDMMSLLTLIALSDFFF